jgi:hypothetical protein
MSKFEGKKTFIEDVKSIIAYLLLGSQSEGS